jgi:hypothetical protein
MGFGSKFKHHFSNAFREIFIYHHNSLEFRAKVFAMFIAANEKAGPCEFDLVTKAGMDIYDDEDRANTLMLTTKEYVKKVHGDNGLDIDDLVAQIVKDLKVVPRYALKLEPSQLIPIIACSLDEDTTIYQQRMLEFISTMREEYEREEHVRAQRMSAIRPRGGPIHA